MTVIAMSSVALPAGGTTYPSRIATKANVRDCENTSLPCGKPFTTLAAGSRVRMDCWIDGSSATGRYTSKRWFRVRSSNGVSGYVHSSLVDAQTKTPHCPTVPPIQAARRAALRVGQVKASDADAALFSRTSWNPGPYKEWAGDCPKLGVVAWRGFAKLPGGDAWDQYRWYKSRNLVKQGTPPTGALVFFEVAMPYGHVAVSLGGNRVATTRGLDGSGLSNARGGHNMYRAGSYRGWALPLGPVL